MSLQQKTAGKGICSWPVASEFGVVSDCGRLFTKYDPRQKVCPDHGVAYRAKVDREKVEANRRKRLAK